MPNQLHLARIKQGSDAWNAWRKKNPTIEPGLRGAKLRGVNLSMANLIGADLSMATLTEANLTEADLTGATLIGANLDGANLRAADLSRASVGYTDFGNVDLGATKGLDTIQHDGPSTIGIDTIYASQGKIPDAFLRGCGVPDGLIAYLPSLLAKPLDYYSCFISYSSKDQSFAERLHADLQEHHVRVWFAPEDMKIGDEIRPRIDQAIRVYDKLLVVISEHSIASQWVQDEVEAALEKERRTKKLVLFPIRLDNAVMDCDEAWAAAIRRQRHIGDFSFWKDHDSYQKAFDRLLRDLKTADAAPDSAKLHQQ